MQHFTENSQQRNVPSIELLGNLKDVSAGLDIVERCLTKATMAKLNDAPAHLDPEKANIWHQAQAEAYRHALEMCNAQYLKKYLATVSK